MNCLNLVLKGLLYLDSDWVVVEMSQEPQGLASSTGCSPTGHCSVAAAPTLVTHGCLDLLLCSSTFPFLLGYGSHDKRDLLLISENTNKPDLDFSTTFPSTVTPWVQKMRYLSAEFIPACYFLNSHKSYHILEYKVLESH